MCLLEDKQVAIIGDIQVASKDDKLLVALIGGQTGFPFRGTSRFPLLGDKQVFLIGGRQTGCPYWGTNWLPLLSDKQVALIGGMDKQVAIIERQTGGPYLVQTSCTKR